MPEGQREHFHQRRKSTDVRGWHVATALLRPLPDFVIIGAQRCGTTSLYRYLCQHPQVRPARRKETHFFDFQFERGPWWYRAHFPLHLQGSRPGDANGFITGEATPAYLLHPLAPERMKAIIPATRLVVVLRDPAKRAWSHYTMARGKGVETRSFGEVIRAETDWAGEEMRKTRDNRDYYSWDLHRRSYVTRGIYVDQLLRWWAHFPREQLLILSSEEFFDTPAPVLARICEHLRIPGFAPDTSEQHNYARRQAMPAADLDWLQNFFAPHNERLFVELGRELPWEKR